MKHTLKTVEPHFQNLLQGKKTFEIRYNEDRDFNVGDVLYLEEYPGVGELRLVLRTYITHILTAEEFPEGLKPGYVILSIAPCELQ